MANLLRAGIVAVLGFMASLTDVGCAARVETETGAKATVSQRLPVYAWCGVDPDHTTVERYRELADAGFTHNLTHFPDADAQAAALDVAQAAGIKIIVYCPELVKDPPATVRRFMDHPAVGGWFLRDEPSASDFDTLAKRLAQIEAVDKNQAHLGYINLLPNYASASQLGTATYEEYVGCFIKTVPVKAISFDNYPVSDGAIRGEWYENLESIAKAASSAKKPFYGFALSWGHGRYPVPTLAQLRLQVYSNLAYGAQGIEYFTYWTPPQKAGTDFQGGPIGLDGNRTVVYDRVKQMNTEIQGLSGVFLGAEVLALGHTGKLPKGTRSYEPSAPIKALNADGGAVVSLLGRATRRYLVIVNRDFDKPMTLELAWEAATAVARVAKDGREFVLAGDQLRANVEPGDAMILSWLAK